MSACGQQLIKKYSSPYHGQVCTQYTPLDCTVIPIKSLGLFLLKIPRRHQSCPLLSLLRQGWQYLMSAWGKLSNVITSQVLHPIRRDAPPSLITQKIGGNTERYWWPEYHCHCDSVRGMMR